jgi:hypothetical protein
MRRLWPRVTLCALFALGGTTGCCARFSSALPEPSDLVGTWRAYYEEHEFERRGCLSEVTGIETLTLRADGTYQQVYEDGKGYVYVSSWSRWFLESSKGSLVLHLEGGRFYPLGIDGAERLASGQLSYHSDDDGRGNSLDLDGSEVILNVVGSYQAPGGRFLDYPPVCDLDSPVIVTFHLVAPDSISTTPP